MRMSPYAGTRPRDGEAVKGAKLDVGTLRRVGRFARPYRRTIALFLVAILAAALLQLVPPLVVRRILDVAIPDRDTGAIKWLTALAVAAALADAGLGVLQRWCSAVIGEGLIADLRKVLFAKVQRLPLAFFSRTPTGAITSRLTTDVVGAQSALTSTLGSVFSNVVVLTSALVTMLLLEWRLTLLSLVVLPLFVLPAKRVGRRLQAISREQMTHNAAMSTQMTERFNVSGAVLVKLFGSPAREDQQFGRRVDALRDAGIRQAMLGRVFFVALALVASIGTVAIYGIGGHLVVDGDISSGTLVALATLVTRIYGPLTQLTNARVDLMTSMVSFERVFEVLDAPEPITDRPGAVDLVDPAGRIEFRHVRFRYPTAHETSIASMETIVDPRAGGPEEQSADVLADIDLVIEPGETLALVGASGSGKSTLANLIPRLYDVSEGSLVIDGHDVRDLTLESLRAAIGVVPQDPHLFHESIGDNLRYARPDASEAELLAACEAARILPVIEALPDGFATIVGERGYRLSGGEKQRMAIARLLLKDPAVVILDEATSALDNDNEAHIQASIEIALHGRTAIVIAHRLSTVRDADRIAVLSQGRIAELGTHEELAGLDGLYAAQLRAGQLLDA